ncbi:MAG TPA: phosphodiester glycosidase family protein [Acidimicrobiia bacterium]|nr:phosphodiester glycosidase family protein [Acidimicrobiia bacterium]
MSTTHQDPFGAPTDPHLQVRGQAGPAVAPPPRPRRVSAAAARLRDRRRLHRLVRRIVAGAFVIALVPAVWSYYRAVTATGSDPVSLRSIEWLKGNGMNGVVNTVEHWYYANNPPPVGGKPQHGLPHAAAVKGAARTHTTGPVAPPHLPPPTNMQPVVTTPLAGEGVWTPTGRAVDGLPAVYTTYFRPDAVHTSLVAAAMWMDTNLLKAILVPGTLEPGGPNPWGAEVPPAQRASLVATFNSGFKISDSRGGYYNFGQMIHPLVNGVASLVVDTSGRASVGLWGRDFTLGPSIATVRQNLALLIDNGQLEPGLASDSNNKWGATLGNSLFVWRSGVGTDANGALVYVGGPGLSIESLAILLQRAGAVRAMELDINTDWVAAFTYAQNGLDPTNVSGVKLLPSMVRPEDHYLTPGERDFFALFAAH